MSKETGIVYESYLKKLFEEPAMHSYLDKVYETDYDPEQDRRMIGQVRRWLILNAPKEIEYVFKEEEFKYLPIDELRTIIKTKKRKATELNREMRKWYKGTDVLCEVICSGNDKIRILELTIKTNIEKINNGEIRNQDALTGANLIITSSEESKDRISSMVDKWEDGMDVLMNKISTAKNEIRISRLIIIGCEKIIEKIRNQYI